MEQYKEILDWFVALLSQQDYDHAAGFELLQSCHIAGISANRTMLQGIKAVIKQIYLM